MTRRIIPLTGEVLVELLPPERVINGVAIPDHTPTPEEVQASHHHVEKPKAIQGIVRAIGKWPMTKNGMAVMPQFGVGAKVVLPHNAGIRMQRNIGEQFRMVRNSEVLAVLV